MVLPGAFEIDTSVGVYPLLWDYKRKILVSCDCHCWL